MDQITERGLGNGASLIIFFSIVERFWPGIFGTFGFVKTQAVGPFSLVVLGIVMVAVVAGTIAVTMAARRVMIQIPQRTMARGRQREAANNSNAADRNKMRYRQYSLPWASPILILITKG